MGISRRNPRGNFNWQSRYLKKRAICCGELNESFDCDQLGPVLSITGEFFCIVKPVTPPHTITVTNTRPGQAATTLYEWYFGGSLVYSSMGPVSSYVIAAPNSSVTGIYTIVATDQFGCVTTESFELYGFEQLTISTGAKTQPSIFYSQYDPGPYISDGEIQINVLAFDPNFVEFVYEITGQNYMVYDDVTFSITSTNLSEVFSNLPNGRYSVVVKQRMNVNGTIVDACSSLVLYLVLGPLYLKFDDPANFPVANPNLVSDWNTFLSSTFSNVKVVGSEVYLYGNGVGLTSFIYSFNLGSGLFGNPNTSLLELSDHGTFIVSVYAFAFTNCQFLDTVRINAVTVSGLLESTFDGCVRLAYIEAYNVTFIGVTTPTIGFTVFKDAGNLSGTLALNFPKCNSVLEYAFRDTGMISLDLPVCIKAQAGAFMENAFLVSVNLPMLDQSTLVNPNLNIQLFQSCVSLPSISLPLLPFIGEGTFANCTSLASVSAPKASGINSVLPGPPVAFANCTSLSTLYLPCCIDIGNNCGLQSVFSGVLTGGPITITINVASSACNAGAGDLDIQQLVSTNPGSTVNYVTCP